MTDYECRIKSLINAYPENDLAREYIRKISENTTPLTAEDLRMLPTQMASGNETALQRMVEGHLLLVVDIVKSYLNCGLAPSELLKAGNIALINAAKSYTPECGRTFSHYAGTRIRHAVIHAFVSARTEQNLPRISIGDAQTYGQP